MLVLHLGCGHIENEWQVPWCIGGDFNAIRFPSEKLGASRMTHQMCRFNKVIEDHGLVDLRLKWATFSWTNNQEKGSSWFDKFFIYVDWMN